MGRIFGNAFPFSPLVALLLLLPVTLSGCAATAGETAKTASGPSREEISAGTKQAAGERPDVERAYKEAGEAYAWFTLKSMPCDETDTVEYDGHRYLRVMHDTIRSLDDLRAYLNTLFSEEIVAQLLGDGEEFRQYRDFDGKLYVVPADRGTDITKGRAEGKVAYESPTQIRYDVTVELLNPEDGFSVTGTETHEFLYEYRDGGRWVFTAFSSVR
jgi:hypothetical protein